MHHVVDIEHRLAEELIAALAFQGQQTALNCTDGGGGDVAIVGGELLGVVTDELQHAAQVFQIQQQQLIVIGDFKHHGQHARLCVVQIQHA